MPPRIFRTPIPMAAQVAADTRAPSGGPSKHIATRDALRRWEHTPFVLALAAAAAVRAIVGPTYRPALLLQTDAYVYLNKALDMQPSRFRPVLYSLFLKPFLLAGSIALVPWLQHGLGLAIGASIYLLLRRLGVGPRTRCPR
jgi:hypothetical protein